MKKTRYILSASGLWLSYPFSYLIQERVKTKAVKPMASPTMLMMLCVLYFRRFLQATVR